ncbi:heme biosynthesis HemY N-terminal domain-containing protein [Pseudomonas sp. M30-35]|uniref:heme biosynthesis HemY N-terminal domain-containing protein n=1 Tax=Pseudomonas sp. M30-35 TaxID=1981174 RepID=UPI000B3CA7D7|nr:heme biosynthesis HemY N-terminal domain-containing protein [Pseudomonas sp. M30-35]ARU90346.1 heme biosynthesis protein HemY [Pseudomonas sp. M30-35]
MKRASLLILILLVAGGLALLGYSIAEHKGYVLLAYKSFRYESSLWIFLALIAAIWLIVYLLRLLLRLLVTSGRLVNPWSRLHHNRRVRLASEQGFVDLVEGRWSAALRHLRKAAEAEPLPLMYYLGAARAAHELGQKEECDALLERALERQPQAELAVALSHAEFQQARGELGAALETLQVMHERHPSNQQVLKQLQQLYVRNQDWSALLGILSTVRKEKMLSGEALADLELKAWRGRLATAAASEEGGHEAALTNLNKAWKQLSAAQQQEPMLVAMYAEQLRQLGSEEDAEAILRAALKRNYDSRLVRLYGLLRSSDGARQLQTAESWLKAHPTDADLLLTLGRICEHNQLWGKAKEYFDASLRFQRHPETCAELARLLAQLGDVERSNQLFQEGLGLLDQRLSALPVATHTHG